MEKLGTIKRITDLRKVWPSEPQNFTKWVIDNIELLSETIGMELEVLERESSVGRFSLDVYAKEVGTNRKVIIENQIEETNHDHLGKAITYASGKDADVVVWVAKSVRDEHRHAIEWLNAHTDENLGFFLLEIQLWQIDDSKYAPKFEVIERPNDWAKSIKAAEGLTETQKKQLEYWSAFCDFAKDDQAYINNFSLYKPQAQNWYAIWLRGYMSSHINLVYSVQKSTVESNIYISDNKELYNKYYENRAALEDITGCKIKFNEASKDCRLVIEHKCSVNDAEKWQEFFRWQIDMAIKLKQIIEKYEERK